MSKDFTIIPDGRKNALDLVFRVFPELTNEFDGLDDDFLGDIYYVHGFHQRWLDGGLT